MNNDNAKASPVPTGAKLLAILAIGAAGGGCFLSEPGETILNLPEESLRLMAETEAESRSPSIEGAPRSLTLAAGQAPGPARTQYRNRKPRR